ncbi:MAG: hypothetical protein M0P95_17740 [Sulfuritalea sp.]|jgi:hypothetical protein|nr:hypothetical protein [Sulfuritalea sp.]
MTIDQLILQTLTELKEDMRALRDSVVSKEWGARQQWRLDDFERRLEVLETKAAVSVAVAAPWKVIGGKVLWVVIGGAVIAILQAAGVHVAI